METFSEQKVAKKVEKKFYCEQCDYLCSKKFNWDKHLLTSKHSQVTLGDAFVAKVAKSSKKEFYSCEKCKKIYSSRNGLWKHKKICYEKIFNDEITTIQ